MKFKSLQFQVNFAIVFTCVAIALVFAAIFYPFEKRRHEARVRNIHLLLDTIYQQKKEHLANELFARQRALAASLDEILKVEGVAGASMHFPDGKIFMSTREEFSYEIDEKELEKITGSSLFLPVDITDRKFGMYCVGIEVIGKQIGFLRMFYDFADLENEKLLSISIFSTLLLTILLLLTGLLNMLLSNLVIEPIGVLRDALDRVREGHWGETVDISFNDEIGALAAAFNEMSEKMEESREALERTEAKYRGIFENAIEGLFQSTPGEGRFFTVNPAMARMLGYDSPEELISRVQNIASQLYVDPDDRSKFNRILHEKGKVVGFETRLHRKEGGIVRVAISARAMYDESGKISFYEGSFEDVTERREKERAEREREAALAANRAKSEFLANMSHEIRTPMNLILGFSDLLYATIEDPKQKSYLESVKTSGKCLLTLINDILDLSKIEAGKMDIHYQPMKLEKVFKEVEQIFAPQAEQKNLELISDISPRLPRYLLLDETRFRQILFNLVGNAVKFTETGFIRLSAKKSGENRDDGKFDLVVEIEDSGIGIPDGSSDRIFESFTQPEGQSAERYGGTGLGLAISKKLAEMMGGSISVERGRKSGSLFIIELPGITRVQGSENSNEEKTAGIVRSRFQDAVVIVADRSEAGRKLIREFLEGSGLILLEAESSAEVSNLAGERKVDLVLIDVKMHPALPDETEALVKECARPRNVPVVALTASALKEDVEKIKMAGFEDCLIKPIKRSRLIDVLERLIERHRPPVPEKPEKDQDKVRPSPEISPETRRMIPEIISNLENEIMKEWRSAMDGQHIPEIENFGNRIGSLGKKSGLAILSDFGENLLFHVGSFDVDMIGITLKSFPELVEYVKNLKDGERNRENGN